MKWNENPPFNALLGGVEQHSIHSNLFSVIVLIVVPTYLHTE